MHNLTPITFNPEVMGGKPCIRGMRVTVGLAKVRLQSGHIRKAELHWYEAHGIGKKKIKIKRFLD